MTAMVVLWIVLGVVGVLVLWAIYSFNRLVRLRVRVDNAWSQIATHYKSPDAVEAARMRLATLILSLVPDTKDATEMEAIAVQEMTDD